MDRRTFVIGLGSVAAAGGAVLGSGAFSSVFADREVAVDVVGDASAYLQIAPTDEPDGAYAVQGSDGQLALELTEDNDNVPGDGVNAEAVTVLRRVFLIGNQGTQPAELTLDPVLFPSVGHDNQDVLMLILPDGAELGESIELDVGESRTFSVVVAASEDIDPSREISNHFEITAEGTNNV